MDSSSVAISSRDEIALVQAAAEAVAMVTSASAATADVVEEARATKEEEEEESGGNEGTASNPTHNWACSGVEEGELIGMAADGAIPPSSESAPSWRSAFGDPSPTPIKDERVLLSCHIARGFSLPPSAFFIDILDHYGLQLHNITPTVSSTYPTL